MSATNYISRYQFSRLIYKISPARVHFALLREMPKSEMAPVK